MPAHSAAVAALTRQRLVARLGAAVAMLGVAASCSVPGPGLRRPPSASAEPARVILYRDTVTVEITDGALCVGPRTAPGLAWGGTLAGCPHRWPYRAELPSLSVVRLPLLPGTGGQGSVMLRLPDGSAREFSAPEPPRAAAGRAAI